ncbi:MAG: hypothetical protein DWQ05_01560 [Calditrichaeota bacterium]|nr:MAG: hypothetical protein DWQ05_01560 [Calditrichota bacterium]
MQTEISRLPNTSEQEKVRPDTNELQGIAEASSIENLLVTIDQLFERNDDLNQLLSKATQIVTQLLNVDECQILWLGENDDQLMQKASFYCNLNQKDDLPQEHVQKKLLETHEIQQIITPRFQRTDASSVIENKPDKIFEALYIDGQQVGYVVVPKNSMNEKQPISGQRKFITAIARQISHAIEMQKMRQLLSTNYAIFALKQDSNNRNASGDEFRSRVLESVQKPEKVAKIVARSFFKDLRKAGFEVKQILVVASEIIENLNEVLRKTRQRRENERDGS